MAEKTDHVRSLSTPTKGVGGIQLARWLEDGDGRGRSALLRLGSFVRKTYRGRTDEQRLVKGRDEERMVPKYLAGTQQ